MVKVALRPNAWQQLAGVYGPAGQQPRPRSSRGGRIIQYSASISTSRRNQTVRALHDITERLDSLIDEH